MTLTVNTSLSRLKDKHPFQPLAVGLGTLTDVL